MSPLTDYIDDLVSATARRKSPERDPASPNYGNLAAGPSFTVGFQKASSHELRRMGREYGLNIYLIFADLDAVGNAPVGQHDTINVDGLGDLNAASIVDYRQPDEWICRIEAEVTR